MKLSETPAVRWGGRAARYKDFPRAVVRAYDPYSLSPLTFQLDLEMTAWHHVRFRADVKSLTCRPTRVQAKIDGKEVEAEATFTAVLRDGRRQYHLVCRGEPSGPNWRALAQIARHNGAVIEVHDRATLAADAKRNARLVRLVQASVIHLRDGPAADPLIVAAVRDGCSRRSELIVQLKQLTSQLIDGRAAQLHCAGVLQMDLAEDDFGVSIGGGRHG